MNKHFKFLCISLFWTFVFCFLFFLEKHFISHVIGSSVGAYGSYMVYAVIVVWMSLLWLVQRIAGGMEILNGHPFTARYVPCFFLLPLMGFVVPKVNGLFVAFTLSAILVWYVCLRVIQWKRAIMSGPCGNMTILLLGMVYVAVTANANDVQLYQVRMSAFLNEGNYEAALAVGKKSLATDGNLTNMRAFALNCRQSLGESLFEYALPEGQIALNPHFKAGGIKDAKPSLASLRDYEWCELLLRKNLDAFVQRVKLAVDSGETSTEKMPKHFREALILYNHLQLNPEWKYTDAPTEQSFRDYMEIYHREKSQNARSNLLRKLYGGTYWWYYHFHK